MPLLKSKIATGFTTHTRFSEVKRTFKYNLQYLLLCLNESKDIETCWGFNWNKKRFFSLNDSTYLTHHKLPLLTKAKDFISKNACKSCILCDSWSLHNIITGITHTCSEVHCSLDDSNKNC